MKIARQHTRDRHEDRCEREEKLGQAMDTLPGKTLRDRTPAARRNIPRSKAERNGQERSKLSASLLRASGAGEITTVKFSFFAPEAESVQLAGDFNNWNSSTIPLKKRADGFWEIEMQLNSGAYEYRFIVDGRWEDDPQAADSVVNPYGSRNSVKHVA
jgi:5'-AMP-activated protein kinase regulatory beta subunit